MSSFGSSLNVAIIGATGGIGQHFVQYFQQSTAVQKIWALGRTLPNKISDNEAFQEKCSWITVDLENEETIDSAAKLIKGQSKPLHIVIVAVGLLHDNEDIFPEKTWKTLNSDSFEKLFRTNTFGPALAAKHFLPLLSREKKSVFAALSARVGSITDNKMGGWHSYRASKAALNMLIKNFSIELSYRNPSALCIGLHPGTVNTALSAPFQSNVPPTQLFHPSESVKKMVKVLNNLDSANTGNIYAWDGEKIPA